MILIALAALFQPSDLPDLARSRWYFVGRSDQVAHYVDEASIVRDVSSATAILRLVPFDRGADREFNVMRISVDCVARSYVRSHFYRLEGAVLREWDEPVALAATRVPARYYPMAAATVARACEREGGEAVADPEADARLRATGPGVAAGTPPSPLAPPSRPPRRDPDMGTVSNADYPSAALRAREQGRVIMQLSVGVDGRVTRCVVTRSSGSASLDETSCRLMTERARYIPAEDEAGRPIEWHVTQGLLWTLP